MPFKNLRKKIESKRGDPSMFWRASVWAKDSASKMIVFAHDRTVLRKYNLHKNISDEYNQRLYRDFAFIKDTPPIACNPNADVEVHTLTSHFHIYMYIASLKSLLTYYSDLAIIAHNGDDTLTDEDKALLHAQIPGIRIIEKEEGEKAVYAALSPHRRSLAYRKKIINSIELFDHILLAGTKKIITMNSDILFFAEPTELIRWIRDSSDRILYVHEELPVAQVDFLKQMGSGFPPHVTIALACFPKAILDLPYIEDVLKKTKRSIWSTGQCIYPLLFDRFMKMNPAATSGTFDQETYAASGIFKDADRFRHYWASTDKFADIHAADVRRVAENMSR